MMKAESVKKRKHSALESSGNHHDASKTKNTPLTVSYDTLLIQQRCIHFHINELAEMIRLVLLQVGTFGFLTKTPIDWADIGRILNKPPEECEFLLWNFRIEHFRSKVCSLLTTAESLGLIVMDFDPHNIIPKNVEHEHEFGEFCDKVAARMGLLTQLIDRFNQNEAAETAVQAQLASSAHLRQVYPVDQYGRPHIGPIYQAAPPATYMHNAWFPSENEIYTHTNSQQMLAARQAINFANYQQDMRHFLRPTQMIPLHPYQMQQYQQAFRQQQLMQQQYLQQQQQPPFRIGPQQLQPASHIFATNQHALEEDMSLCNNNREAENNHGSAS